MSSTAIRVALIYAVASKRHAGCSAVPQDKRMDNGLGGNKMVGRVGLEPTTIGLKVRCSTN